MTLLLTQISLCLLIAALIGVLAGWFYRRSIAIQREDRIQDQWKQRIHQIEVERDRNVHRLNAAIDQQKNLATQSGQSVALEDYENLTNNLADKVAEREEVIAQLREETQSVRAELAQTLATARQRETGLLQQHEQETANLVARLDRPEVGADADLKDRLALQHEQEIKSLTARLGQQHDAAMIELDTTATEQHEQELARLSEQLTQQHEQSLAEQKTQLEQLHQQEIAALSAQSETQVAQHSGQEFEQLRQQHEQELARLKSDFAQQESQALSEQVMALREQHDQDITDLTEKFELQQKDAVRQRERQLLQAHQQEVSMLNAKLAQQTAAVSGTDAMQIKKLQSEIKSRDDSIAVLRDDLAALNEKRPIDQRGRQDDQLRAAIDDVTRWQDKYEMAAAELAQIKTKSPGSKTVEIEPELVKETVRKKHQRSGGDRIGSVLSHPGGHTDKLQEIKGIGPVLERKLNDVGIYHFKQIAAFSPDDIVRLNNELGRLAGRIERDKWVAQARKLHKKYHG